MPARCTFLQIPGVYVGSGSPLQTAGELALLQSVNLRAWFDAEGAIASGGSISLIRSRKTTTVAGVVTEQEIAPVSPADAPVLVDSTDDRQGVLCGLTAIGGSVLSGEVKRMLSGNSAFTIPHSGTDLSAFTIWWLGVHSATTNGIIWSTQGATPNFTYFQFTTAGQTRLYHGTTPLQGTNGDNDGNLHLWVIEWNGTNATFYRDGTSIKTGAWTPAETFSDTTLSVGAQKASGAAFNGIEGYWESFGVMAYDAGNRALIKAMVNERHAGLVA